jgi:methylated-DNA-protein-cysteine methyltransferase related protein
MQRTGTDLERVCAELAAYQAALDQHALSDVVDTGGNITRVKDLFCQISGHARAGLLGQNHLMLLSLPHQCRAACTGRDAWHDVATMPKPGRRSRSSPTAAPEAAAAARERRAAAIVDVVNGIPPGRVTTYGAVAARAGLPRQPRLVGKVLSSLPAGSGVPWHRVVAAGGRIAFPAGSAARERQLRRLRAERVALTAGGRVDLARHGWGAPVGDLDQWLWSREA